MTARHDDPDSPGFRVTFDPSDHRRVGHGADFGADLYDLYRAGRVHVPETALGFAGWAGVAHDVAQRTGFLDDSVGRRYALVLVEEVRAELASALRETAVVLDGVGSALVTIAADFARTDAEAAAEFNRLVGAHPGLLGEPTPTLTRPPGAYDPFTTPYDAPSLEAPDHPFFLSEGLEALVAAGVVAVGAGIGAVAGAVGKKREEARR